MTEWKDKVKQARQLTGLSQNDLSQKTGIPITNIQKWEQGVTTPSEWRQRLYLKVILEQQKNDIVESWDLR